MPRKVILLVDDDSDFRESVRDVLMLEDYEVIAVSDGRYALPVVEKEAIDLVVTDILMPDIEGVELCININAMKPDLKVIGMTGGSRMLEQKSVVELCSDFSFETVLCKPFTMEELLTKVEQALT